MKALPALICSSLLLAAPLPAQEAPQTPAPAAAQPPVSRTLQLAPREVNPPTADPILPSPYVPNAAPNTPLIPDTQTVFIKPPSLTQKNAKLSPTEDAENELRNRIHFREAKIAALDDPAVKAAWAVALSTKKKTDYEQREAVKKFYTLLFDRMTKIDNSIPTVIAEARRVAITRETQIRITPTERPDWIAPAPAAAKTASR